ncbi:glycerol-3-phosphate dehydrogenase/oxidase [Nocardioides ferulae]|uniref:glycerol-3-phosphate dehydrogenase/oxidase n=1 Tax=Nocardioides ferulae TaxID=2340821 RepID=UPI000EAD65DC|nr:glycerol-3-phosphate dehydrogenase/oxidase [Nocardioides ferulae]
MTPSTTRPVTLHRFVESPPPPGAPAYDVLVVGGGITGAALAYEAASRGCTVALVEADDFGAATSAATGKLVHGGLRYLKQLEVRLVRESLRERRVLSNIAPNLVRPYPIALPDAGLLERAGLTAYDLLSFDRNRVWDPGQRIPRHRRVHAAEASTWGLGTDPHALLYHDCTMPSPERLTLAFVRSAVAHGADVANHTRAERFLLEGDRVVGAQVRDALTGHSTQVRARVVVNATGPWAHDVLMGTPGTERAAGRRPPVRSEGIYLVTRQLTEVMTLHVTPHGHFSCAPWRGHSLIGPTESPYRGAVHDWRLTRRSIEEFLVTINSAGLLPVTLGYDDVLFAYGGLRPLTEVAGETTYDASRASEHIDHAHDGLGGLITVTGGKYTTSRGFAEHTYRTIARKLGRPPGRSRTARTPLHGCDTGPLRPYLTAASDRHRAFAPETVRYVALHHGTEHDRVLALADQDPALARALDADGELLAQVVAATRWEMARTLRDVLLRRTGIGTLGHPGDEVLEAVARTAAAELGWSDHRTAAELDDARQALALPA